MWRMGGRGGDGRDDELRRGVVRYDETTWMGEMSGARGHACRVTQSTWPSARAMPWPMSPFSGQTPAVDIFFSFLPVAAQFNSMRATGDNPTLDVVFSIVVKALQVRKACMHMHACRTARMARMN